MEYKVVITKTELIINKYLQEGWIVDSVTPQRVSTGSGSHLFGDFCFVLKREI
jgi:hypothetical protein